MLPKTTQKILRLYENIIRVIDVLLKKLSKTKQELDRKIQFLYNFILLAFVFMHCKIYKARLINKHNDSNGQNDNDKNVRSPSIHAYYGMLQHVFQRNRHMIKELKLSGIKLQQTQQVKGKVQKKVERSSGEFRNKSIHKKGQRCSSVKNNEIVEPSKLQAIEVKRPDITYEKTINCFIPIGQAFHNSQAHKINQPKPFKTAQKGFLMRKNMLSPSQKRYMANRESYTQRDSLLMQRRLVSGGKRSLLKIKSQGCEETNHSSIRNSQKSNPEHQHAENISMNQVFAPW